MNHLYTLLLSMLALVLLIIGLDWFFRYRQECRDEQEQENNRGEVRAGGLLGKHRKPNSKDGALDTELVLLLGLTLAVVGTVLVLGGLGVMWLVLLKQWVLGVGNRRKIRFSSRQMGRVESASNSWVGRAHCGQMPDKDSAQTGCDASAGSDSLS